MTIAVGRADWAIPRPAMQRIGMSPVPERARIGDNAVSQGCPPMIVSASRRGERAAMTEAVTYFFFGPIRISSSRVCASLSGGSDSTRYA